MVGGTQPLRGFGLGRYVDRDSFSTSVEVRRKVVSFDATSTIVDVEVTPFIDVGRVFSRTSTNPLNDLHHVYGVGFRGIARPFVVGYVDIGYGSEGIAAFPDSIILFELPGCGADCASDRRRRRIDQPQNLRMRSLGLRR